MRRPSVQLEIFDRAEEGKDDVQVRRRAGEEAGGDAARQRARRKALRRGRAREQRAREGVGQRVQRESGVADSRERHIPGIVTV